MNGKNGKGKALFLSTKMLILMGKWGHFVWFLLPLKEGLRVKTWQNWVEVKARGFVLGLQAC